MLKTLRGKFEYLLLAGYRRETVLVEKGAIDGGRSMRRRFGTRLGLMTLTIGLGLYGGFSGNGAAIIAWHVCAGLCVGLVTASQINRERAYARGWLDGRENFFDLMVSNRRANPGVWISEAMTHDMVHVMGFEPHVPDDASGLEG